MPLSDEQIARMKAEYEANPKWRDSAPVLELIAELAQLREQVSLLRSQLEHAREECAYRKDREEALWLKPLADMLADDWSDQAAEEKE